VASFALFRAPSRLATEKFNISKPLITHREAVVRAPEPVQQRAGQAASKKGRVRATLDDDDDHGDQGLQETVVRAPEPAQQPAGQAATKKGRVRGTLDDDDDDDDDEEVRSASKRKSKGGLTKNVSFAAPEESPAIDPTQVVPDESPFIDPTQIVASSPENTPMANRGPKKRSGRSGK
jgi:hypothetical protein